MRILLTGALGFLGGRVLDFLLADGFTVRALVRRPAPGLAERGVEVRQADLRDPASLDEAVRGADGVIHCAAKSGVWGPLNEFIEINTLGTHNLLRAARRAGAAWFVHTSSPSVAHTGRPLDGVDENAPYTSNPRQAYPYSKMLAERLVLAENANDFHTTALRPHLIWGPGDPHFLPRLAAKAGAGRLYLLKSNALVDGTFIDNAAGAHLLAARKMISGRGGEIGGRAYFIAQGEPLTAAELIGKILEAISAPGRTLKVKALLPARLGLAAAAGIEDFWRLLKIAQEPPLCRFVAEELTLPHWFNLDRARRELGYKAEITMAEGLRRLKEHCRK